MALLVPNQGEELFLKAILNHTAGQNLVLRLYVNDKTPAEADTEADYTEAVGNGYASVELIGENWVVEEGSASYAQQTFTFTGALGNVYGYYMTQAVSGKLVYAERFSTGPFNIQNNGDQIKITPQITLD